MGWWCGSRGISFLHHGRQIIFFPEISTSYSTQIRRPQPQFKVNVEVRAEAMATAWSMLREPPGQCFESTLSSREQWETRKIENCVLCKRDENGCCRQTKRRSHKVQQRETNSNRSWSEIGRTLNHEKHGNYENVSARVPFSFSAVISDAFSCFSFQGRLSCFLSLSYLGCWSPERVPWECKRQKERQKERRRKPGGEKGNKWRQEEK